MSGTGVPYKGNVTENIYVFDKRSLVEHREIQDFVCNFKALEFHTTPYVCDIELFKNHLKLALDCQSSSKDMMQFILNVCTGMILI